MLFQLDDGQFFQSHASLCGVHSHIVLLATKIAVFTKVIQISPDDS